MDGHRPGPDLKFHENICPDQNGVSLRMLMTALMKHFEVPVIVVFTKYDQFLRNVMMDVLDDPDKYPDRGVSEVAEQVFCYDYDYANDDRGLVTYWLSHRRLRVVLVFTQRYVVLLSY